MKLKTYTAESMAQALAHVRKDLGKDAMILHTRSFRVGSWFGIGGKTMVEITASSPEIAPRAKAPRAMPRVSERLNIGAIHPHAPAQTIESKPIQVQMPSQSRSQPIAQAILQNQIQPEMVIQRGRTVTRHRIADEHSNGHGDASDSQIVHDRRGLNGRDALFGDISSSQKTSTPPAPSAPKNPRREIAPKRLVDQPIAMTPNTTNDKPVHRVPINPTSNPTFSDQPNDHPNEQPESNDQLRAQIDTLSKMMGQVLESTRKTAVAVGSGNPQAALPTGEMPAPLFALYAQMMDNDVPVNLADKLVGIVRDRLDAIELKDPQIVRQAILRAIESTIGTRSESLLTIDHTQPTGRPRVIALVGPTGVGKTTTVAKLAATYKLRHNKDVGLITSDTYRIAAVEQLRTYAGIIGLPLKVANTPDEMRQAIKELGSCDVVVIDTAGRSQNNTARLEELAEFTQAAAPDETHLVLSTTVGDNVLRKTAQRFKALGPDRCILTKLDEAVTTGPIAGLSDRIGLPLSFITVGQEVPDDLEPARADRLARCVLDGPDAVVRRPSEENG